MTGSRRNESRDAAAKVAKANRRVWQTWALCMQAGSPQAAAVVLAGAELVGPGELL
jgi:hypothetical protein